MKKRLTLVLQLEQADLLVFSVNVFVQFVPKCQPIAFNHALEAAVRHFVISGRQTCLNRRRFEDERKSELFYPYLSSVLGWAAETYSRREESRGVRSTIHPIRVRPDSGIWRWSFSFCNLDHEETVSVLDRCPQGYVLKAEQNTPDIRQQVDRLLMIQIEERTIIIENTGEHKPGQHWTSFWTWVHTAVYSGMPSGNCVGNWRYLVNWIWTTA